MTAALELEVVPCPLCGGEDIAPLGRLRDVALGVPGEFALARCRRCGLLQQNPRVRTDQLELTYPDDYPRHVGDPAGLPGLMRNAGPAVRWALKEYLGYRHLDTDGVGLLERLHARRQRRRIEDLFPPWTGQGRLLDVGCATGRFLALMTSVGWQTSGVEIDEDAAAKARTVTPDVFVGDPVDASFASASFDVVTAFHVIEHLPRPREALARMLGWLAPGGLMIIEVPNAGGLGARAFGRYWSGLDFPRHLVHFTPATMAAMVERAGGQIVGARHRTKPRWLTRSARHWLGDRAARRARWTLAALESRLGSGVAKLVLEIVLPAARRAGLGEMVQYAIRHRPASSKGAIVQSPTHR